MRFLFNSFQLQLFKAKDKSYKINKPTNCTSFQQTKAHGGDLNYVLIVPNVPSIHSGSLSCKTTGIQLHDLLTCLKDLQENAKMLTANFKSRGEIINSLQDQAAPSGAEK